MIIDYLKDFGFLVFLLVVTFVGPSFLFYLFFDRDSFFESFSEYGNPDLFEKIVSVVWVLPISLFFSAVAGFELFEVISDMMTTGEIFVHIAIAAVIGIAILVVAFLTGNFPTRKVQYIPIEFYVALGAVLFLTFLTLVAYFGIALIGEDFKKAIEYFVLGVLAVGGIWWQVYLLKKDRVNSYRRFFISIPFRLHIPIGFCLVITAGVISYGVIRSIDVGFSSDYLDNIMLVAVFSVVFIGQVYFGPIVISSVLSYFIYNLFEHNTFVLMPLLEIFLDFVFSSFPGWLEILYVSIVGIYTLGSSIHDSIS